MATAIYMRVSTEKQEEHGVSLETQKERLQSYCIMKGLEDTKEYLDVGSGRSADKRENLKRMIKDIKEKRITNVVILKLDRLTRSIVDLNKMIKLLNENECELHSCTENLDSTTASGRMMMNLIGTFAQWESETISERVAINMQTKAEKGIWMSSIPFGFKHGKDKRLEVNNEEANILKEAFNLVLNGMSFTAAEKKISNQYNLNWSENYLTRKLKMHSTAGDTYRNGKLYKNTHEGIITKKERDKLIEILENNKTGRRFIEQDDLFRRRVKCSQCNSVMSVNARSHDNYKTIHYSYVCNDCHSKGRPFMSVSESILENAFYDYMRDFPITDLNKEEGEEDERDNQIKNLLRRRKNIDRERDKIQRAWIKDMMSDEDLKRYQKELDKELSQIEDDLSKSKVKRVEIDKEELKELITYFNDHFRLLSRTEKRSFIQQHIRYIEYERKLVRGYKKKYDTKITNIEFF